MLLKTESFEQQKRAIEKLKQIKVGALYMEQGTGKTRTALELANIRLEADKIDIILWLCPCNVKTDLKIELKKHTDDLSKIVIRGIETLSTSVKTNIELLNLVQSKRVFLIVDESIFVKNHYAYRTRNITRLAEYCKYKLILNGTPISRTEKDLYAQWYILDWRILGYKSYWSFARNHIEYDTKITGKIKRCLNVDYLVKKIANYTYQVRKDECLDLPEKTYETVYCDLTKEQEKHYDEVADKLMFELDEMKSETIYRLFSGLQGVIAGFRVKTENHLKREPFFDNSKDNPRIQKLLNILDKIEEKVIIYCKYTYEIEIITNLLNERYGEGKAVPYFGEIGKKQRQKYREQFEDSAQFLIANKRCAGYGFNFQFCSYVIFYNNDWDYATRIQSEDRVHRIGQVKNVHIIDICASYTLDERILKCLRNKKNLIEEFKEEIDKQKDKKTIEAFIYKRTYRDHVYKKIIEDIDKKDLLEVEKVSKVYLTKNVYEAFQERLAYIFSEFDNIYISFSGGKDSGLLLNLVIKYMKEHNIQKKIGLFHQDFEAQYEKTTEYVTRMFANNLDYVEPYWVCLPMASKTPLSNFEMFWHPWDPDKKDIWVRDMPEFPYVINQENNPFSFYKYKMLQEDLFKQFGRWYKDQKGGKTIGLLGLRADESLHRYSAIANKRYDYKGIKWITKNFKDVWSASPIYDWTVEDVWTANGKFDFDYNKLYDLYYKAGLTLDQMRVASPFNEWAMTTLNLYRVIEPKTWAKLCGRVVGANFASIYGGTKAMGYREVTLPAGHTWKSYTEFLLSTLPENIRENYLVKFKTSMEFWKKTGGGFAEDVIKEIEECGYRIRRNGVSNFTKDKKTKIVFEQEVPDNTDDVKSTIDIPSWKRMCYCILKNDHECRFMGFGLTKQQQENINKIKDKYKSVIRGGKNDE